MRLQPEGIEDIQAFQEIYNGLLEKYYRQSSLTGISYSTLMIMEWILPHMLDDLTASPIRTCTGSVKGDLDRGLEALSVVERIIYNVEQAPISSPYSLQQG
jgi:hypothetical protein